MPTSESVRIASSMVAVEGGIVLSTSPQVMFTANPNRKKIILFAGASGNNYSISTSSTPAVGNTMTIYGGTDPTVIDQEVYGNYPQQQLFVVGSSSFSINYITVSTQVG